jgi:hypothetical protein
MQDIMMLLDGPIRKSISDLVAEYIVAIDVTRAQLLVDACTREPWRRDAWLG